MRLEDYVFSCDFDENDIDQEPNFIRANGEIVANTEHAFWQRTSNAIIVVASNTNRGNVLAHILRVYC